MRQLVCPDPSLYPTLTPPSVIGITYAVEMWGWAFLLLPFYTDEEKTDVANTNTTKQSDVANTNITKQTDVANTNVTKQL